MNRIVSQDILSIIRNSVTTKTEKETIQSINEFSTGKTAKKSKKKQNVDGILSTVLDQSDEIIFVIDDTTNVVFVNQMTCELLGYEKDEILELNILDIAPNIEEEIRMLLKVPSYNEEDLLIIDVYYKSKDNVSFLVEVEILRIVSVGDYFCFRAKDIIRHNSFNKQLKFKELEFVELVEHLPILVLRYNANLTCTYVNEVCEKITGYHRFKIIERNINQSIFLSNDQILFMEHNLRLVLESGLPIEFELLAMHKSRDLPNYLKIIIVPENNAEAKIIGAIVLAQEITESKLRESELVVALKKVEDDSRKQYFLINSLGHSVFDVLNALVELSQMLKDENLTSEKRNEFINLLDESTKDIMGIGIHIHSLVKGAPE